MDDVKPVPGPSRKRRLLAVYIDYLVFTAAYQPIAWTLGVLVPASSWVVTLTIFVALRSLAAILRLVLPGNWALGIRPGTVSALDSRIRRLEQWWTVTAGTLFVLEGSKNVVRWTQGLPIEPLLGPAPPQWAATVAITALGGLNMLAGLLILRTWWVGAVVGISVLAAELVASVVHREAFSAWAADAVVARRALQGIPVRDGEIEVMQAFSTSVLPVVLVVGVIWLLFIATRFRTADRDCAQATEFAETA